MRALTKSLLLVLTVVFLVALAGCSSGESSSEAVQPAAGQTRVDHAALPSELPEMPEAYYEPCEREGTIERFDYQTVTVGDNSRPMDKYAFVYLPYGYDANATQCYDIVYLMHGMTQNAEGQLGVPGNPSAIKRMVDHLIDDGLMEPTIIVSVSYYPDNEEQETTDYDAQLTLDFGAELRNDLMPALEERYHTYAESTTSEGLTASRAHRAFGGFSMGAVTTWYRACDSMDYFKYFIPVSGSLLWGVDYGTFGLSGNKVAGQIADAIEEQGYGRDDFFVFTTAGTADFGEEVVESQLEGLLSHPALFSDDDSGGNANIVFLTAEGEDHSQRLYARSLYTALPLISAMMHAG